MITPEDIVKRATRKYPDVLRAWLSGTDFFPLEFPAGKAPTDYSERQEQLEALKAHKKQASGHGYVIQWKKVRERILGEQDIPTRIVIDDIDDYLALTGKRREFDNFVRDVGLIRTHLPASEAWLQSTNPKKIIANHGKWCDLLAVCNYFMVHPHPDLYIRELPISVHTKFIESNKPILRDLLDNLLSEDCINQVESDFCKRFGLKEKTPLIRMRCLDAQLVTQVGLHIDDLTLPVDQLAHVLEVHIQPQYVIIAENIINFLTLPDYPDSIGLFGSGFAVHLLRELPWIAQCEIIYWGDIDAHGFQILSGLREIYPHVQSIMMDHQTLNDNTKYAGEGVVTQTEQFSGLAESEYQVLQHVLTKNLRLEQEHIPHAYAVARLNQVFNVVDE
jgi:hypothetical protein